MLKFPTEMEIPEHLRGLNTGAWQIEIMLRVPWDRFYLQAKSVCMHKLK